MLNFVMMKSFFFFTYYSYFFNFKKLKLLFKKPPQRKTIYLIHPLIFHVIISFDKINNIRLGINEYFQTSSL